VINKVSLLSAAAVLLVSVAIIEGLILARAPAPATAALPAAGPDCATAGLVPPCDTSPTVPHAEAIAENAPSAETAVEPHEPTASTAACAAPAALTPEQLAAKKDADYRCAVEILADNRIAELTKAVELTADQCQALAPAFARYKAGLVGSYVTERLVKRARRAGDEQKAKSLEEQQAAQDAHRGKGLGYALCHLQPALTDQQKAKYEGLDFDGGLGSSIVQ
jgi:xanthosine utilization system XapX-like protein